MKKKIDFTLIIGSVICLLPILLGLALYGQLPEQVAIHWNSAGQPDGYMQKAIAITAIPLFLAAINLIVNLSVNNDPKKVNILPKLKTLSKWIVPVIGVIIQPVTLFIAMGAVIPIHIVVPALVGALIIITGNYLPKSRQNYTVGIRLPWTLHSEENWNKTHRMAGCIWILCGLAIIISGFLGLWLVAIIAIALAALGPVIYSFALYKKSLSEK